MAAKGLVKYEGLEFKQAIKAFKDKDVLIPKKFFKELPIELKVRAFYVAGVEQVKVISLVKKSLQSAIKNGSTFKDWKKTLSKKTLKSFVATPETVFRTNIRSAYSKGAFDQALITKDERPYLLYTAIDDNAVRDDHIALNNVIRKIDDGFWDTYLPPNGYNCRCGTITLNERQAQARSKDGNGINKKNSELPKPDKGFGKLKSTQTDLIKKNIDDKLEKLPKNIKSKYKKVSKNSKKQAKEWYSKGATNFKK